MQTSENTRVIATGAAVAVALALVLFSRNDGGTTAAEPPQRVGTGGDVNASEERARWDARIDEAGAAQAYEEYKAEYAPVHFGTQHYVAHIMGELLYEKLGLEGLTVCDSTFAFGCYHSFFGRALAERGLGVIAELDTSCLEKFGPLGTGCQHGIGHGLVEYMGHDKLLAALDACAATTQKNPMFGCTSGVFMEYNVPIIINVDTPAYTKWRDLDPENPYAPCPSIPEKYRESCYHEMGQWWDKVYAQDYKKIGELCAALEGDELRESCFSGIGNVAAPSSEFVVAEAIRKCALMPDQTGEVLCRSGASWSFFSGGPSYRSLAPAVCEGLPEGDRRRCAKITDLIEAQEKAVDEGRL